MQYICFYPYKKIGARRKINTNLMQGKFAKAKRQFLWLAVKQSSLAPLPSIENKIVFSKNELMFLLITIIRIILYIVIT
jgi:hypothetical protein